MEKLPLLRRKLPILLQDLNNFSAFSYKRELLWKIIYKPSKQNNYTYNLDIFGLVLKYEMFKM